MTTGIAPKVAPNRADTPAPLRVRPGRPGRRRTSVLLTALMLVMAGYTLLPLVWLFVNATKSTGGLFSSFGLWFADENNFVDNVRRLFAYNGGQYLRWLLNTLCYAVVGAGGATLIAAAGGHALAKFTFAGRHLLRGAVLGSVMIPGTALAIPTYLLFSRVGLVDTPLAVILPSLVSPFGLFLMSVYIRDSVPDSLVEAARIDGYGEWRIFWSIGLPLMRSGLVTVFLFQLVAGWNNYFLPLIVLNNPDYFPVTVGLNVLNQTANTGGAAAGQGLYPLVITGALLALLPLIAAFLLLQRYWQSGLATGSVKD